MAGVQDLFSGQDLLELDELPGTGQIPDTTQLLGKLATFPDKEFRFPAARLPRGVRVVSRSLIVAQSTDATPGELYAITGGWNGAGSDATVLVWGIPGFGNAAARYDNHGLLLTMAGTQSVTVDVADVTYSLRATDYLRLGSGAGANNLILGAPDNQCDVSSAGDNNTLLGGYANNVNGSATGNTIQGGGNNTIAGGGAESYILNSNGNLITDSDGCTLDNCSACELDACSGVRLVDCGNLALSNETGTYYFNNQLVTPGGGSGGGIDYGSPVTHAGNTTLTAADCGQHHLFTGTSAATWTVALPDPATASGKTISLEVAATASGMWAIQASSIDGLPERRLRNSETKLLRCDGTAWHRVSGVTIPLTYTATTSAPYVLAGGAGPTTPIPFNTPVGGNAPAQMHNAANGALVALRGGRYVASVIGYCMGDGTAQGPIELFASRNGAYNDPAGMDSPCPVSLGPPGSSYAALQLGGLPLALATGDYLNLTYYLAASMELRNTAPGGTLRPLFSLTEVPTW